MAPPSGTYVSSRGSPDPDFDLVCVGQASQITEKVIYIVNLSGAKNLSFFFLGINQREIPCFARNDKSVGHFFRRVFTLSGLSF